MNTKRCSNCFEIFPTRVMIPVPHMDPDGLWCPHCALRIASVACEGAPDIAKELINKARVALLLCSITYQPGRLAQTAGGI